MAGNKERKKLNAIEFARTVKLNCLISTLIKSKTSKIGTSKNPGKEFFCDHFTKKEIMGKLKMKVCISLTDGIFNAISVWWFLQNVISIFLIKIQVSHSYNLLVLLRDALKLLFYA